MTDLLHRNDEWNLDNLMICADVELTIEVPGFYGPAKFTLVDARTPGGKPVSHWLFKAMEAWVAANQAMLAERQHEMTQYSDVAE